jgi:hypothetical protein
LRWTGSLPIGKPEEPKIVLQSGSKRKEAHIFYEKCGFDGNSKRAFEIRF